MSRMRHVLLAEDDENDIELVKSVFDEARFANRLDVVKDGAAALDYLRCQGEYAGRDNGNPAVILLDIKMPKMDGLQVLKELKQDENIKYIPVVMVTSSKEESDLVKSYHLGVNAYVVKPVDFNQFVEAVKQVGLFWGVLNETPFSGD